MRKRSCGKLQSVQYIVNLEPSQEYRTQQEGSKGQQESGSRRQEEDTKKLVSAMAGYSRGGGGVKHNIDTINLVSI